MSVTLAPQQITALDRIGEWLQGPDPVFSLQGYAGTGKTTIAIKAAELSNGRIAYLAPTGKAASVMRRKGCEGAQTIHRALYRPKMKSTALLRELTDGLAKATTEAERQRLRDKIKIETQRVSTPGWDLRESSVLQNAELVIVDEASMVADSMLADIGRHAKKILCLSDPAQLPPVLGRSTLMEKPADMLLTDVHRQALDSPVLRAATAIRNGDSYKGIITDEFSVVKAGDTDWDDYRSADQVLVATNATRGAMNTRFRQKLNLSGLLAVGDRCVFLRNNYDLGVYNGTTGTVTAIPIGAIDDDIWFDADFETDEGPRPAMPLWTGAFGGKPFRFVPSEDIVPADYAYALTVHKAQGSEWNRVLVWDEYRKADRARWLYTAVTRAAKSCLIVEPS
jgi:exodeoxyribonuclease-5